MMNYELAIDEDGEPFSVPPQVAGWRVRRAADGRGRPVLVHDNGKPLVVRANASHADLLAAAGPGRYRLEAVDEQRHKIDGVPVACTGPLSADDGDPSEGDSSGELVGGSVVRQVASYQDVLCHVVSANTRMVERALGQMGSVMAGVAELLNAAHNAGITNRVPPPPMLPPVETYDEEDQEAEQAAPSSGVPDIVQLLIKETVAKVVPLIFEKLTGGGSVLGGLPLEALLDWRKAVPNPTPPSAPVAAAPGGPAAPSAAPPPPSAAESSWATSTADAFPASSAQPAAPPRAGAAPSRQSPLGAAPAEMPAPPTTSSPRTEEELAAALNAHVLQVWQGLDPAERARAGQLIARLSAEERTAWLAELAQLTVPEAIARARAVIHGQPSPTLTPQLPTATSHGEPS